MKQEFDIFRELIRKYGATKITLVITLFSSLISTGIATILDTILKGQVPIADVLISFSIPLVLAPVVTYGFIRLSHQLHIAEEQMRSMASEDFLTKTYNRRHFMKLAEIEVERAKRYKHSLSLLLLDVDNFKSINDSHGHAMGDEVLKLIADTCKSSLRKADIIGRFGGEEFVILLPETHTEGAQIVAERIRKNLQDIPEKFKSDTPLSVSASIGVVTTDKGIFNLTLLLSKADKALYKAKEKGRNRTEKAA